MKLLVIYLHHNDIFQSLYNEVLHVIHLYWLDMVLASSNTRYGIALASLQPVSTLKVGVKGRNVFFRWKLALLTCKSILTHMHTLLSDCCKRHMHVCHLPGCYCTFFIHVVVVFGTRTLFFKGSRSVVCHFIEDFVSTYNISAWLRLYFHPLQYFVIHCFVL